MDWYSVPIGSYRIVKHTYGDEHDYGIEIFTINKLYEQVSLDRYKTLEEALNFLRMAKKYREIMRKRDSDYELYGPYDLNSDEII